jgi:uncharacterized protein (TIGR02594 family)
MIPPPWLAHAYDELGVHEIAGSIHEERILAYHDVTTLKATEDEIAWCSSFACWVMEQASIEHTRSARARSWLTWGKPLDQPRYGCVVVLARGVEPQPGPDVIAAPGHVGFWVGWAAGSQILVLGGNQGNAVSVGAYPARRCLGLRWPLGG